jgi:flavin-dependent dehydrogenase
MDRLSKREHIDFLVLGGGIAGLSFALEAGRHGSVTVLAKRQRSERTRWSRVRARARFLERFVPDSRDNRVPASALWESRRTRRIIVVLDTFCRGVDMFASLSPEEVHDEVVWMSCDVVVRLLIELRRANRSVIRLRAVALAARDGDGRHLLAALARLRHTDLHPRHARARPTRVI